MSRFNGQLSESNGLKDTKCPLSEDTTSYKMSLEVMQANTSTPLLF